MGHIAPTSHPETPPVSAFAVPAPSPSVGDDLVVPPQPATGLYGVFRAGPFLAAVSIDVVREVVPRSAQFTAFPSRVPEVLGAMDLRGTMIPVVDLAPLLGGPADNRCTVVMVVRVNQRLCGLLIDHIDGVEQIDEDQFTAAETVPCHRARPALVIAGFASPARSGIVLDCAALARVEGMPLSLERNPKAMGKAEAGEPTLLFSAGAHRFGLAAHVIDASIPCTVFEPTGIDDPVWAGMLRYKDALIPVVDTLALIGLGHAATRGEGACVVVRFAPDRLVALRIDRVHDMQRVTDDVCMTLQGFPIGRGGLLQSMLQFADTYLLIDPERLLADPVFADIAALGETTGPSNAARVLAGATDAFLVMGFGKGRFATPMRQVEEIIPAGPDQITVGERRQGIVGLIAHRGRGVPLYNLSGHLGLAADDGTGSFLVIVGHEGRQVGFLINGLCSVERVAVQKLGGQAGEGSACGTLEETIFAADGQTACVIDLEALVRDLVKASGAGAN